MRRKAKHRTRKPPRAERISPEIPWNAAWHGRAADRAERRTDARDNKLDSMEKSLGWNTRRGLSPKARWGHINRAIHAMAKTRKAEA